MAINCVTYEISGVTRYPAICPTNLPDYSSQWVSCTVSVFRSLDVFRGFRRGNAVVSDAYEEIENWVRALEGWITLRVIEARAEGNSPGFAGPQGDHH